MMERSEAPRSPRPWRARPPPAQCAAHLAASWLARVPAVPASPAPPGRPGGNGDDLLSDRCHGDPTALRRQSNVLQLCGFDRFRVRLPGVPFCLARRAAGPPRGFVGDATAEPWPSSPAASIGAFRRRATRGTAAPRPRTRAGGCHSKPPDYALEAGGTIPAQRA